MHTYIHTYMHEYAHTYMHVCTYTHVYIHIIFQSMWTFETSTGYVWEAEPGIPDE